MPKEQYISKEGMEKEYFFLLQTFFDFSSKGAFEYEDTSTPYDLLDLPQDLKDGNTTLYYEVVFYFKRRSEDAMRVMQKGMNAEKVNKAANIFYLLEDLQFLLEKHMFSLYIPKFRKIKVYKNV